MPEKKTIFNDESGLYDGQVGIKPPEVLVLTRNRRRIVSPQVDPILQRLIRTEVIIGDFIIDNAIIWLSQ